MIWLVTYLDRADVAIERGENKGKQIAYTQIVTGRQVLGMWDPAAGATLTPAAVRSADRQRQRRRYPGAGRALRPARPDSRRRAPSLADQATARNKTPPA